MQLVTAKRKLLVEHLQNFLGHHLGLACGIGGHGTQLFQHHHKLIPPQPGHGVHIAHAFLQAAGHLLEQQVPHVVAQGVVQDLEVVQVNKQQGTVVTMARTASHGMLQAVDQHAPVRQAGQRIKEGQAFNLSFGELA